MTMKGKEKYKIFSIILITLSYYFTFITLFNKYGSRKLSFSNYSTIGKEELEVTPLMKISVNNKSIHLNLEPVCLLNA